MPEARVSPEVSQQMHAQLAHLAELLYPTNDLIEADAASGEGAKVFTSLAECFSEMLPVTEEDIPRFNALYLDALLNTSSDGRNALTWFLDMFLGQTLKAEEEPHEHTLTVGITGLADMQASPYGGGFLDTAPLAAWIARETGITPESVGVLAVPYHPDDATVGLTTFTTAVIKTRFPERLREANESLPNMEALPNNDGEELFPVVFVATLYLKDADEVSRIRAGLDAHLDRMLEEDADDSVRLPYQVGPGEGDRKEADLTDLCISMPFSALSSNAFAQQLDDLDDALETLTESAVDTEGNVLESQYSPAQLGMRLRIRNRIDWSESEHAYFEIYEIATDTVLFDSNGVQMPYRHYFFDAMSWAAQAWELGEIRIAGKVVYQAEPSDA